MLNVTNSIAIVIATAIVLGISFFAASMVNKRSKSSGNSNWATGGQDLPLYVIIGTQFASAFGGGILVGQVGNAYNNGLSVAIYGFYSSIVFFIFMFIARWLRRSGHTTIPEIVNGFFGGYSKRVSIIAAAMALVVPFGWIGSQLVAFAKMYSPMTGINYNVLIIGLCIVSVFFVMPAGLKTVAWTDFIFSVMILIMLGVILVKGIGMGGGAAEIMENIPRELITFPDFVDKLGWDTVFLWTFAVLPGAMTNQLYLQRIVAIDDEKNVNKSLAISGILVFLSFVWAAVMGLTIKVINPALEGGGEGATGWFVAQLPTVIMAIFAGLLCAAIMSTISSAVQSVVVNITTDLYSVVKPDATDDRRLKLSKVFTIVVMAVAAILSVIFPNVLGWFTYAYTFSAASLLCPIFVGYILKDKDIITEQGMFYSILLGIVGCIVSMLIPWNVPDVVPGIIVSFVALIGVSKATKKQKELPANNA